METAKCELCGEPMPPGEQMFKFHGYSGPCPTFASEPAEKAYQALLNEGVMVKREQFRKALVTFTLEEELSHRKYEAWRDERKAKSST